MYFRKMKTDAPQFLTANCSSSPRISKALLLLATLFLFPLLLINPAAAKQNDTLPPAAMAAISKTISPDLPAAYDFEKTGMGYSAENHAHKMKMSFSKQMIRFCKSDKDHSWAFALTGIGYQHLIPPLPAEMSAERNRLELRRGRGLTEWYLNTPFGVEQGFTLHRPPAKRPENARLRLELTLQGAPDVTLEDNHSAVFKNSAGVTLTRYAGLYVTDADNKTLCARLEIRDDKLIIAVDDTDARYPITVDPWIQQAKLTADDAAADDWFGFSVAMSGDTVVVGAKKADPGGNTDAGAAYLFVKPVGGWSDMTQTVKLTAGDAAADDQLGWSAAVSGDTVVIGAISADAGSITDAGAAYLFVKPVGGWSDMTQTAKLTADDATAFDQFGYSVAMSGDTAVIGSQYAEHDGNNLAGAAYVFVKPVGGWSDMNQTAKLTAGDAAVRDYFGTSVAVSGDTAVVGAYAADHGGNTDAGAAYVFVKPVGGWSDMDQTAKLTAGDAAAHDRFGITAAVSGDTAVVGAFWAEHGGNNKAGAAYLFVKPVGGWSDMTQTAKLTAGDAAADDWFGSSVAMSGDTAVIGAKKADPGGNTDAGAAYLFVKPVGGWSDMTHTAKLTAGDATADDWFGDSVAISGEIAVVGALWADPGGNTDAGAAYMFGITEINLKQGAADIANGGSHDFSSQLIGSDTDAVFTIENTGSAGLTLTTPLTLGGADPGEFAIVNHPDATVAPGGNTTFTVRFSPVSEGAKTATISIDNNDSDENPYVLNLQGEGTSDAGPPSAPSVINVTSTPSVINVTSTASSGSYSVGSVIVFTVHFSELIWVKGVPLLILNVGGPVPGTAWYSGGSGADMLRFRYIVAEGDDISDLDYWSKWSLELNGGQIYSNQGIDADLDLSVPGEQGSIGYNTEAGVFGVMYPVYRFYSAGLSKHLFTIDEIEKDHLIENASEVWRFENIAYYAYRTEQYDNASRLLKSMLRPVYRFYSEALITHLFTIDENEKNHLITNAADVWRYEGVAFYIPGDAKEGTLPIYRFYSDTLKVHLFTADENEKNHLIDTAGDVWRYEGIAYYAYP